MAKVRTYSDELEQFKSYLKSTSNEDARRPLLYPLFQKLFAEKFKIESDAKGADGYVEGKLIIEAKTDASQWLEGFYQALHYHKKYGLSYSTIIVIAHKFIGIWKLNTLPEHAVILSKTADSQIAPSNIGKENAKRTDKLNALEIQKQAFYWLSPKELDGDIFAGAKNLTTESYEILKILLNLDSDRLQVNTHNFIDAIERLKSFFENPIDAIHAFYTFIAYWDITSTCSLSEQENEVRIIGFHGSRFSDAIHIKPRNYEAFKKFIECQYIFTNEGSGLSVDYYFSRFDEVLSRIDPEYVKQHGIFFTDINLSKFALWFAKKHFPGNINEDYIVFDPAGGSGNLVSSWKGKLKHKIISDFQPDLLKIVERRMKADPFHLETGFTIIPKTSEKQGLNFLDKSSEDYLTILKNGMAEKNQKLNKPLAFLMNPPYKNTKENENIRLKTDSDYDLCPEIIETVGKEGVVERYLSFLGQALNISKIQNKEGLKPILLVFTPTSWLIPRPAFATFKTTWDKHFKYENGFLITSNEFFKIDGKWPIAFTMWSYNYDETRLNTIFMHDYTEISKIDFNIDWEDSIKNIDDILVNITEKCKIIQLNKNTENLREFHGLKLFDFIHTPSNTELSNYKILGGLPLKDERRQNKKTYGVNNSNFIGFLDDSSLARIKPRGEIARFSQNGLRSVWFRLDTAFKDANKAKCFNGPADNRSYAAHDLKTAKVTFSWFAICKSSVGKLPIWANQKDIWPINFALAPEKQALWHALCFAFILAENRCVITKFEKNNPVQDAPEIFVENPLCPINKESFWYVFLENEIIKEHDLAFELTQKVKNLYQLWNLKYCKGNYLTHVGLQNEPYFKYFDYADFLTPHSGLIQIKKYAEINEKADLLIFFSEISAISKKVKNEIFKLLTCDFKYFD